MVLAYGRGVPSPVAVPLHIELHLRCRVAQGRRDEFLAFLREAIPFYEAPGGIAVRLLQDTHHADRFVELVRYDDQAVFDSDQERVAHDPTMKTYLIRWRELLAEPPVVEVYRPITP